MNDPNTRRLHLVIFDCDGVLVDSERIAVRVDSVILAELGWPLSEAEIIERFVGRSEDHIVREIEAHIWAILYPRPGRTRTSISMSRRLRRN